MHREKTMLNSIKQVTISKPRRQTSKKKNKKTKTKQKKNPKSNVADTLISDFQPRKLREEGPIG